MIQNLPKEATMISDVDGDEDGIREQPVIVEDYAGSSGIGIRSFDGNSIYIPYRMVKEVIKVMKQYSTIKTITNE